ncbi:hypothetical protein BCR33DRAFT_338975 [Rhizoclosmatium globosum]|uniref:MYND-type domain-containing protein n=1 Tax=Rhizoclosmatium globosum TaxID=329046 RepID=A0A1Y1ZZL2_9FUNG|nr:hypothetical protein BCR33DRAFT_338975 [Rhizoclosmatium globosum]|eukprot:ORY15658.1 hypothetical protein BCR33DRAFT_338975 [Rhizoclosmatium globosum]
MNDEVWIPVDNFFQQDHTIYIQVSLREYLDAPQGLLNQMLYLWNAGAEELYIPPDKLLDVNPSLEFRDYGLLRLQELCLYGSLSETQCNLCGTVAVNASKSITSHIPLKYSRLKKCKACSAVYYCSRECQREHWKEHKLSCRPVHELKKGDLVRLLGLSDSSDLNRRFRELGNYVEAKGRWEVTWIGGTNGILVKPENLKRR